MNRCASLNTLGELKLECEPELIRAIWKASNRAAVLAVYPEAERLDGPGSGMCRPYGLRELKRHAINRAGGFYGVEYTHGRHYLNAGDTYAPTLVFNGDSASVSTLGDLVEKGRG